jgi:hypothetical protein
VVNGTVEKEVDVDLNALMKRRCRRTGIVSSRRKERRRNRWKQSGVAQVNTKLVLKSFGNVVTSCNQIALAAKKASTKNGTIKTKRDTLRQLSLIQKVGLTNSMIGNELYNVGAVMKTTAELLIFTILTHLKKTLR